MPTPPAQKLSSPAKRKQATAASGGGIGIGLLALIAGLVLQGHYGPIKRVCDSGLGALGQALEPSAQQKCSLDSLLAEVGTIATVLGVVILAGALLVVGALFVEARLEADQSAAPKRPPVAVSNLSRTRADSSTTASRKKGT